MFHLFILLIVSKNGVHNSTTEISISCSEFSALFVTKWLFSLKTVFLINCYSPSKMFKNFILVFKNNFLNHFSLASENICYLKCDLLPLEKEVTLCCVTHTPEGMNKLMPFSI